MRVVLDTNIFISGTFWKGNFCSITLEFWKEGKITLIISPQLLEELIRIIRTFKVKMDEGLIKEIEQTIIETSILVEPAEKLNLVKEDPKDNIFLEAAIAGKADYIISQDRHLLKLKGFRGIKILTPEEFNNIIK